MDQSIRSVTKNNSGANKSRKENPIFGPEIQVPRNIFLLFLRFKQIQVFIKRFSMAKQWPDLVDLMARDQAMSWLLIKAILNLIIN